MFCLHRMDILDCFGEGDPIMRLPARIAMLLAAFFLACLPFAVGQETSSPSSAKTVKSVETLEDVEVRANSSWFAVASAADLVAPEVSGPAALQFVAVTPCRIADTRNAAGAFGGPELAAGAPRAFDIPQSACGIPATAVAYSLNVTVVPIQSLGFLTIWPAGQAQPVVSTLNSDGRVKANATITPAGTNGGVSVYASDATQFILDIDGYFVPVGISASGLEFFPLTPCRIADTRNADGPLGGPFLAGESARAFPVQASACGIPSTAQAYSLNVTAVPHGSLGFLTAWPSGQTQPVVSTLNSSTGAVTANAAIVPAGSGGDISIYVSDASDAILDVNGYFAAPATGGLALYTVTPCRALDTRGSSGAFDGTLAVDIETSACAPPATAQDYVLNGTAVPVSTLSYLTLWAAGGSQPDVSTLNASDGAVTSNMAIVPTTNGSIDAFATNSTQLILDLSGYFAPPPPGVTVTLLVNPTPISLGSSATLTWSSINATSCSASGAWSGVQAVSGTQSVTPTVEGTETYNLTCTGIGGSNSASTTLTVNAPPSPTVTFSINPTSIALGSSAMLTWSSTNATSCSASGAWSGALATSGSQSVTPTSASLSMPGIETYTVTCQNFAGTTATGSAALSVAYPIPTGRLSQVRSFEYVIAANVTTPGIYSDIANSRADLVILNECANNPPLDRTEADSTGTKLIFGYVDVAEAFSCAEPSLFNGGDLPSWFGNVNPGYSGLYTVQYWNPAWESVVFTVIDQTVADGYDGIFLDVLSGDNEWSAGNIEGNPVYPNAIAAMATLLSDIRNYVNTKYPGKNFYLIGNNPIDIAMNNVASLKYLDAIFNETAYYAQSPTNGSVAVYQGSGGEDFVITMAPLYATAGVPILGNDYPPLTNTSADLLSFALYSSLGWIPSVTTPTQTANIFSTGPFMFMATPTNQTVTGYSNFVNFLSGGKANSATLVGGEQGDFFIGGPGQNTITGGSGDDTIYAHPVNAAEKGELILDLCSQTEGNATTPSVSIEVNGKEVIQPTQITAAYGASTQRLEGNLSENASISSIQIVVTDTSYTDKNNFSNVVINDIIYNGVQINLALGQYPEGGGPPFAYSNNGTVTFPGSAFAVLSPFPANTSDVIDGGGGTNTVIYRAASSNYTVTQQSDGSWLVTSATTAEGPDKMTNIQVLVFSDKQLTLP